MQATDLGHGRGWLDADAAASVQRIDRQLGHPMQSTEAGRTWAQQNAHWITYQRNGKPIALHPDTPSIHQLGNAIDSDEAQRHVALMAEHGWKQTVYRTVNGRRTLVEPWHFEYTRSNDQHRNDSAPTGATTTTPTASQEEEDMSMHTIRHPNGTIQFVDELGSDHMGDYQSADIGIEEFIGITSKVFGAPQEVTARDFDVANAVAKRRWERKKNEIVDAVIAALKEQSK